MHFQVRNGATVHSGPEMIANFEPSVACDIYSQDLSKHQVYWNNRRFK